MTLAKAKRIVVGSVELPPRPPHRRDTDDLSHGQPQAVRSDCVGLGGERHAERFYAEVVRGLTRFTTGVPVTLSESDDASLCGCGGADVPNYNGQPIHFLDIRKTGQWFEAISWHATGKEKAYPLSTMIMNHLDKHFPC